MDLTRFTGIVPITGDRILLPPGLSVRKNAVVSVRGGGTVNSLMLALVAKEPPRQVYVPLRGMIPQSVLESSSSLDLLLFGCELVGELRSQNRLHLELGLVPDGRVQAEFLLTEGLPQIMLGGPRMPS